MAEPQIVAGEVLHLTLGTGREVDYALGELEQFYLKGKIPNDLKPVAFRELFEDKPDPKQREKHFQERFKLAQWLHGENLRNPVVVPQPNGRHEIAIDNLYNQEVWELWRYANSPALAYETFRFQQGSGLGTGSVLQGLPSATEPEAQGEE